MVNKEKLLKDANSYFANREYDKALFLYSQLVSLEPDNKEYKLYALFCDISGENEEKAQSFYDYYTIAKIENPENAIDAVNDLIEAYDGDMEKMMDILDDISTQATESLDAINYSDFIKLVDNRGSFREAFEDIMFSTKVAIYNKEEFCDFVEKLIDNDFKTTAESYLEGYEKYFTYDENIEKLYKKLEETDIENNNKQSSTN